MTNPRRTPADPAGPAEPRHAALWAALTFAACTLLLAWPALGGAFLVNPRSDQYFAGFPFRDFASQALRAGQGVPQWNPYLFGGMPYIASMAGDMFYPTALLRELVGTDVGMTWGLILHVFLAGCFLYGFLRAWGVRFHAALVGGVAYMMSGTLAGLVSPGHDGKLFVSTLLPLGLWMLVRAMRDGRVWAWGGLALAVGLAVLSPHPQLLQYMLLTLGAFALLLAFSADEGGMRLARPAAMRRLGLATLAVALGFLIGAVQYMPALRYVPFSPRAGGRGYEYATSFSLPIEELLNTYLPQFSGILDRYWGRNGIHLHSEYLGAVALLLASAAFGGPARRTFRRFWVGTLVVALLWALGGSTPFYHLVYAIVPGTKFFRAPSTILMVVGLSVAVLAALGTERLLDRARSPRFFIAWIATAAVLAVMASAGMLTSLAQSIAAGFAGGQLDDMIAGNQGALMAGAWRSFAFVAVACGLLLAWHRDRVDGRVVGLGLAALVALDLWSVERLYWQFSPRASVLYASDPAIEFLRTAPTGRVAAIPLAAENLAFHDPNFGYDGLMVHRIRLATGYHGNELGRYRQLGDRDGDERYENDRNPAFWRLMNVRYLYTNVALPAEQGLERLVGPVKSAAGSTVYLYRLPGDNPPAWVAPVMVKAPDEASLGTLLDPRFDPLRAAVVDSASPVGVGAIRALPAATGVTAKVTRYDPGHIALELSGAAPAGSALVVSENWYPGWSAIVDGKPVQTVRADYTLIGVPLPTGARSVLLDFADPAYPAGKLVTIVASLLALGLAAGGAFVERRRRVA